jgi:hypothetical protein
MCEYVYLGHSDYTCQCTDMCPWMLKVNRRDSFTLFLLLLMIQAKERVPVSINLVALEQYLIHQRTLLLYGVIESFFSPYITS